jgi:hypothetical protein
LSIVTARPTLQRHLLFGAYSLCLVALNAHLLLIALAILAPILFYLHNSERGLANVPS